MLDAVDGKVIAALDRQPMPVHSGVVAEDLEQRVAGGEILVNHVGAPDLERLALAQHEQAGGVIDLAVHQHDRADTGVADPASGLQRGKALDLREYVG